MARLTSYAGALRADIVAIQGIDGPVAGAMLFPPSAYQLVLADDPVVQRSGFAVRRGWNIERHPDLAALDPYHGAPYRLREGVDVTVTLPGSSPARPGARLRLLSVHLKSGCRDAPLDDPGRPACATLARQAEVLARWIAARRHDGEAFAVLGDFGRVMEGADAMLATLAASGKLIRPTEGHASPCWGGSDFVDHILLGGAAASWAEPGSLRVLTYRETEGVQSEGAWRGRLSDHCPVSVRLRLPD